MSLDFPAQRGLRKVWKRGWHFSVRDLGEPVRPFAFGLDAR
eukprot:CAMPEP_0115758156 /NCGR_PEP_ID=MMETSP0272-20121206/98789_1 /TAXON_ID=71861 /ORGANISM="Scrippsiella trochoidea, Strain CCMP3099" /LENGTH=40 /DNA_ID= /DNA_START= /DNA_END= /DNA_ORIENTATION=